MNAKVKINRTLSTDKHKILNHLIWKKSTYKKIPYNRRVDKRNRLMKKIIVVTGGAGFIGSNLIKLLIDKNKI